MCARCRKEGMYIPRRNKKAESSGNSGSNPGKNDAFPEYYINEQNADKFINEYDTSTQNSPLNGFLCLETCDSPGISKKYIEMMMKKQDDSSCNNDDDGDGKNFSDDQIFQLQCWGAGISVLLIAVIRNSWRTSS